MNTFFETLGAVEDRVQRLIERLNYQRSENQALRLEIEQLKRTLLVKEEALGICQSKCISDDDVSLMIPVVIIADGLCLRSHSESP